MTTEERTRAMLKGVGINDLDELDELELLAFRAEQLSSMAMAFLSALNDGGIAADAFLTRRLIWQWDIFECWQTPGKACSLILNTPIRRRLTRPSAYWPDPVTNSKRRL